MKILSSLREKVGGERMTQEDIERAISYFEPYAKDYVPKFSVPQSMLDEFNKQTQMSKIALIALRELSVPKTSGKCPHCGKNSLILSPQREIIKQLYPVQSGWWKTELEENGLMPCGCGGSAAYHISYDDENWSTTVKVACNKCLIHVIFSALYELRGEEALADDAKKAWNTAMGWRGKE